MKSVLFALLAFVFIAPACAQQQRKSPHETVSDGGISVTYGRPYKKGRDIFGSLEPYGKVWRAGADEATEITFAKDAMLAGKHIKAGTYTLFVIPEAKEWTIILNSELKQWGAYEYDKIKGKNVAQVKVPVINLDQVVEQFTIRFAGGNMIMEWDKTQVKLPVMLH
ncbi:DUF2911 domain-containing protein [Flavihumibacter rivuli]|uniref:DUF2911 domain-containing protein n=1 Tax=Flavihumibacter rivuli TaxID=2838156 RepID=UPI001BDECB91|nr:DUF2911 domain-containing protein [Flavihumibacter rivuli]ULQ57342.1 DUF2911 domain-containing protein [Flavihumibacter rivuli]